MFIFNVPCTNLSVKYFPHQEIPAILRHASDQCIRQLFCTIIDDGPIKPQNLRVNGSHNNIVDLIKFGEFVIVDYGY